MKVRCGYCKTYIDKTLAVRNGLSYFCSREHVWAKGDKKPKKPKKAGPNPALLAKVKELDGFRCRFCGRVDSLHVHHIVYRSQGGTHDEANLITLCVQHHELVHSNKTLYAPICEEIVNRRTVSGDKTTLIASLL